MKMINVIAVLLTIASCGYTATEPPPYIISAPYTDITGNLYNYNYAGIRFDFFNRSGKTVRQITASFMLFDSKTGTNPFYGSNVFEIAWSEKIMQSEKREVILSLDMYLHAVPAEPYLIDFFYISEIQYTDGSTWKDKYGVYSIRKQK